jgi:uncharacterized protein YkwD
MPTARREFLIALLAPWPLATLGAARADDRSGNRAASIERAIFAFTNQQRTARRLRPLDPSDALSAIARSHSRDMLARDYFDHRTPEGAHSADRIARQGLRFDATAENLYMVKDGVTDAAALASAMVRGWMDSRGHRTNILGPDYRFLGVGVAATSRVVLATQLFAG